MTREEMLVEAHRSRMQRLKLNAQTGIYEQVQAGPVPVAPSAPVAKAATPGFTADVIRWIALESGLLPSESEVQRYLVIAAEMDKAELAKG